MGLYIEKIDDDHFKLIDSRYVGAWKVNFPLLAIYLALLASESTDVIKIRDTLNNFGTNFPLSHIQKGITHITMSRFPLHVFLDPYTVYCSALKEKNGVISPPEVALEVTDRCPYSCRWCFVDVSLREQLLSSSCTQVPLEILEKHLIDPVIRRGGLLWSLTGGEPSIDPSRTMSIAKLISEKTITRLKRVPTLGLITNGWNLEKLAQDYKKAGITTVQIALPTLDEKRDAQYRNPPKGINSVHMAIRGAQAALELGLEVGFNCVIFPEFACHESNMKDIPELMHTACNLNVDYIRLTPVVPSEKSRLLGMNIDIAFTRQLMNTVERAKEQIKKDRKTVIINGVLPGEEFISRRAQSVPNQSPSQSHYLPGAVFCQAGTTFLYVGAQGHVAPCNHVMLEFAEDQTLLDVPIDSIWRTSSIFHRFRTIVPSCEECILCTHRIECTGNCRAMLWERSRALDLSKKPQNCPKDDLVNT